MLEPLQVEADGMPCVAVSGSSPERGVTGTANPDRRMRCAQRPRRGVHLAERNPAAIVRDDILSPALADDLQVLIRHGAAVLERRAQSFEFLSRPTHARAENKTAAAQLVDVGGDARSLQRMAVRQNRDGSADL